MASFEVKVVKIDDVQEHPNADRLTLVTIGGYTCIANKHEDGSWRYQPGDHVVYIPEQALVPEWLLRRMNLWREDKNQGMLAGKNGDRVKAIKLRGIYSEGLLYPVDVDHGNGDPFYKITGVDVDSEDGQHMTKQIKVERGDDVSEFLGITKYEPPIPTQMAGEVFNLGRAPVKFDLEPWEKYPNLFFSDEPVVITEKLHGSFTGISYFPGLDHQEAFEGPHGSRDIVIYSKGLGAKGLVFKDNETNANNIYVRAFRSLATEDFWDWIAWIMSTDETPKAIHILGETYGKGVQDLDYGTTEKEFRIFLIGVSYDGHQVDWIMPSAMIDHVERMGAKHVPILHRGFFDWNDLPELRDGKTSLGGDHVREGVVIYPMVPREDPEFGYVMLKAVSPDYKLRKGGTEYN